MSVEDIINKYSYNEEIANYLRIAYPYFIEEFKDETIVYEALMNTPICLTSDNIYNYLVEHGFINGEDNEMVSYNDLKGSMGVYFSDPIIEYNNDLNEYAIKGVNRIVVVSCYNLLADYTKSTLTHEICHAIKSYNNEFTIENDNLIEKSGLVNKKYELSNSDKVNKTWNRETGVGLEEGLNALAEESIMSKITQKNYETKGYQASKELIKTVLNKYGIPDIENIFKEAELYHDNTRIDEILGQTYYDLSDFADKLYKLNVAMINMANTDEKRKEAANKANELIENEYAQIDINLKAIGQRSIKIRKGK